MSKAKFVSICVDIERRIREGVYQTKLPPTRVLEKEFHVARQTLTNALRPLVEQGILLPAHGRGMVIAKQPTDSRGLVAVVTGVFAQIAQHQELLQLLEQSDFEPFLLDMPPGYRLRNPSRFFHSGFAGILFCNSSLTLEIALYLEKQNIPFLSCNRLPVYPKLNFVESDSFDGIKQLMEIVVARGYHRIAFYFPSELEGYQGIVKNEWAKLTERFALEDLPCNHMRLSEGLPRKERMRRFLTAVTSGARPELVILWGCHLSEDPADYQYLWEFCRQGIPVVGNRLSPHIEALLPANFYRFDDDASKTLRRAAVSGLLELLLANPSQPIHRFIPFSVSLLDDLPVCHNIQLSPGKERKI